MVGVNFQPLIPQPQSSQLTLSSLDKTVINSKNLILQYETDIERLQKGPAFNKMSKENVAAEEKRKVQTGSFNYLHVLLKYNN